MLAWNAPWATGVICKKTVIAKEPFPVNSDVSPHRYACLLSRQFVASVLIYTQIGFLYLDGVITDAIKDTGIK
jgi:hypothetical protein